MRLNEDAYRESLRNELKRRRFEHKHYSSKQIAQMRELRCKKLEESIAENKEEIEQIRPKNKPINISFIEKYFKREDKNE